MPEPTNLLDSYDDRSIQAALERSTLRTTHALLFHTAHQRLQLVTAHRVTETARRAPVIGPGRPLLPADERDILDLLLGRGEAAAPVQVFPENLLYYDPYRVAWWLPGRVRPMHLHTLQGTRTITTCWPSLVCLVMERTFFVVAVADGARPEGDTALFHAPLPNVFGTTILCTGPAALPAGSDIRDIPGWESVLFDRAFTHPNWNGGLAPDTGGNTEPVDRYWAQRDGGHTPFPGARLVPLGRTLGTWLTQPKVSVR